MSEDQSSDPAVQSSEAPVAAEPTPEVFAAPDDSSDSHSVDALDPASIEEMLKAASFEDPATVHASSMADESPGVAAEEFKLPNLNQVLQDAQVSSIELLRDVELNVKIELGRARMLVEDVLKLCEGSVVELDKLAGDPVDVFVNDRLVARGEVLVLNDNFCVRVNEILTGVKDEGQ
jgi:flagellar motor switch protein FliN/FliY